jgi:hypothetical protein
MFSLFDFIEMDKKFEEKKFKEASTWPRYYYFVSLQDIMAAFDLSKNNTNFRITTILN